MAFETDDLQGPIRVLHRRGAAFHPIAVVDVEDAVDEAAAGLVDVAADNAVVAALAGLGGERLLVEGDEAPASLTRISRTRPGSSRGGPGACERGAAALRRTSAR